MNRVSARRAGAAALLAFLLSAGPSLADVKLRIYLQDGALQAGTLVTETPKSFVILTNEGRVEVVKSSIMFINGKTLKQWQDRPDKLFQTEIMPSDVPDPSYVNDKSLPPPPPLPARAVSVTPAAQPKPASAAPVVAPVQAKPVEAPKAVPAPVAPVEKKVVAEPAPKKEPKERAARKVVARREPETKTTSASSPRKTPPIPLDQPATAAALGLATGPGRFDRTLAGVAHRERGRDFVRRGESGRAWQEYEIARLMEPGNPENNLALGKICLERGLLTEARRQFSNSSLRRNTEARDHIAGIDAEVAARDQREWRLRNGTIAAAFGWLPVLIGMRLLRRRRKKPGTTTILADDLEPASVLSSPIPPRAPAPVDFTRAEPESVEETLELPEPPTLVPPAFAAVPEEEAIPEPVAEAPLEVTPTEEEAPTVEDIPAPEPEPAAEEPEPVYAELPARVPAPAMAFNIPPPDPDEILSVARMVEGSLMRANQRALDGRFEEARRSYRTALALNPSCASAHLGLGYLSFVEEKWETALLHYQKALEIDGASADAHYGAARVLLEINRVEDALPELRATLQIDPTYDSARETLTALSKPA